MSKEKEARGRGRPLKAEKLTRQVLYLLNEIGYIGSLTEDQASRIGVAVKGAVDMMQFMAQSKQATRVLPFSLTNHNN